MCRKQEQLGLRNPVWNSFCRHELVVSKLRDRKEYYILTIYVKGFRESVKPLRYI